MKVLFLLDDLTSANGVCVEAIIKQMNKNNWQAYVICGHAKDAVASNKTILVNPPLFKRINEFANRTDNRISKIIALVVSRVLFNTQCCVYYMTMPWFTPLYTNRLYKAAIRLIRRKEIDLVIAVYSRIDSMIVASRLNRKLGIPFVAYFLDPLEAGYWPSIISQERRSVMGQKWEETIMKSALGGIFMKSTEGYYENNHVGRDYMNKIVYLDLPQYTYSMAKYNKPKDIVHNNIKIVYAGSLPLNVRPIDYLFEAFKANFQKPLQITIAGRCSDERELKKHIEKDARFKYIGFQSKESIENLYGDADILLSLGSVEKWMVPSKIFEYMSTGKPIIHLAYIQDDPCIKYLKEYPLSLILTRGLNTINEDICVLHEFIEKHSYEYVVEDLSEFYYLNTPKAFVDYLNTLDIAHNY
jgi:glycosyltransferase involved in cell wall biosynthesis